MVVKTKRYKWKQIRNKSIQNQLSFIYNSLTDLIFKMEVRDKTDIRCVFVNQAYLDVTGLVEQQLLGKTVWEFLPYEAAEYADSKYKEY